MYTKHQFENRSYYADLKFDLTLGGDQFDKDHPTVVNHYLVIWSFYLSKSYRPIFNGYL